MWRLNLCSACVNVHVDGPSAQVLWTNTVKISNSCASCAITGSIGTRRVLNLINLCVFCKNLYLNFGSR